MFGGHLEERKGAAGNRQEKDAKEREWGGGGGGGGGQAQVKPSGVKGARGIDKVRR